MIIIKWMVYDVEIVEVRRRSVSAETVRCAQSELTGRRSITCGGFVLALVALGWFLVLISILF